MRDVTASPARLPEATRRATRTVFLLVLAVYLFTAGGSFATTDAIVMYDQARQIVEAHSAALSHDIIGNPAYRGPDGRTYSPFGLLQSLYDVPFHLAGRTAARLAGRGGGDTIPKAVVALGNTLPMAAAMWITCLFAFRLVGSTRAAVATALAISFGTLTWVYAKFGYNTPLATLCLAWASYESFVAVRVGSDRRLTAAGFALGLALLTRHELVAAAVPVALFVAIESRLDVRLTGRRVFFVFAGFAPPALVWAWWNAIRFGSPLETGYLRDAVPGFGSSLASGLYGLLLSPTASVFAYAPLVLAGCAAMVTLWRKDKGTAVLLAGHGLALLVVYAQLENWRGGRSYGPRYLVPVMPLVCLPIACWFESAGVAGRRLLAAASIAAIAWTLPGVLVDFSKVGLARARESGAPTADERLHDWSRAPYVENVRASAVAVPRNLRYLAGVDAPPPIRRDADAELGQQLAFGLDFWWLSAFYLGLVPRAAALAVGAGGLAIVAMLAVRLAVLTRRAP